MRCPGLASCAKVTGSTNLAPFADRQEHDAFESESRISYFLFMKRKNTYLSSVVFCVGL